MAVKKSRLLTGIPYYIKDYLLPEEFFSFSLFELFSFLLFEDELWLPDEELLLTPLLFDTFPLLPVCPDDLLSLKL
jgi:hypothetical protein